MTSRATYNNIGLVSDFLTEISEFLAQPEDARSDMLGHLQVKASEFGQEYDCSNEKALLSDVSMIVDVAKGMLPDGVTPDVEEIFATMKATISGNLANSRPDDALDIIDLVAAVMPVVDRKKTLAPA